MRTNSEHNPGDVRTGGGGNDSVAVPSDAVMTAGDFRIPSSREFGFWLALALAEKGVSQRQFDEAHGLGEGISADIIDGAMSPTLDTVAVICACINTLPDRDGAS